MLEGPTGGPQGQSFRSNRSRSRTAVPVIGGGVLDGRDIVEMLEIRC